LIEYIGDIYCGIDVVLLIRDIIESNKNLTKTILKNLTDNFSNINSTRVFRTVLWILGDYSESKDQLYNSFTSIKDGILYNSKKKEKVENEIVINKDGTYGSQIKELKSSQIETDQKTLRELIISGNFYLSSVVSTTLTKIGIKVITLDDFEKEEKNKIIGEILQLICTVIKISPNNDNLQMDRDTIDKISLCIKLLTNYNDFTNNIFLKETKIAFSKILQDNENREKKIFEEKKKEISKSNQVDSFLNITQLKGKKYDVFEFEEEDLSQATKNIEKNNLISKLAKVTQLTGFSDPVYSEAVVIVHQFDILLQILIVNQTNDTLQNLTIELATVGDLKLCERPQSYTVGPYSSQQIKANIKVSSTENGIIFGNIIYDVGNTYSNCVILNDIKVDIIDYIIPTDCDDTDFRNMWFDFEWENKVPVSSTMDLKEYLKFIINVTNMKCITPNSALEDDCEFLSANLYAKSSFSEDSLANVSLEKKSDNKLEGYVRIRSKNQGIAFSLGNKILKEQKNLNKKN